MDYEERALLYEEDRLDLELAVVSSIETILRGKRKFDAANEVKKAAELLEKAKLLIKGARKFSGISNIEQLQMDVFDEK